MHFWKYGKKYIANLASGTTFIEYITVLGNVPIGTAYFVFPKLTGKGIMVGVLLSPLVQPLTWGTIVTADLLPSREFRQGKGHWSHWAPQAVVATSDN